MKRIIAVLLITVLILLILVPCVYAEESGSGGGFSIQGIIDAIVNLPNNIIQPIKDAIYQAFKDWTVEMYTYIISTCVDDCLSIIPNFLKDTPDLWSESSPTVINVVTDALKPICLTLATVAFIISLAGAAYGNTVLRCSVRLIVTVLLVGYSAQFLQWIINFNDAFIQFLDARMSMDIVASFRAAIVDKSVIESATATLSSVLLVNLTGWIIWIAALCIQFMLMFRLIQLMFYMLIGPLVFTCFITNETTDIVKSYMRKFISVVLKSFFYNLIIITYITCISLPNAIPVGILGGALCMIVLIFSMFKIPKEFEELLGIGRAATFNISSLVTAIGTAIAVL
ncbi:MAG: hypothetical protein ACM3UU_09985 [Ignavibacteriales bacterium]